MIRTHARLIDAFDPFALPQVAVTAREPNARIHELAFAKRALTPSEWAEWEQLADASDNEGNPA